MHTWAGFRKNSILQEICGLGGCAVSALNERSCPLCVRPAGQFPAPQTTGINNGTVRLKLPGVPSVWQEPFLVHELWVVRNRDINSSEFQLPSTQLETVNVGYEDTMKYVCVCVCVCVRVCACVVCRCVWCVRECNHSLPQTLIENIC